MHIAQPPDFLDLCSKFKDMENRRTTELNGKLREWEEAGFAKIKVKESKPVRITLPYGTTISLDTRDVGFLAELLCQMDEVYAEYS